MRVLCAYVCACVCVSVCVANRVGDRPVSLVEDGVLLVVGQKQTKLTLNNEDLGTLVYDLNLEGKSSTTEKYSPYIILSNPISRIMKFQVPLGSKQPRPFKFIHYCQKQTTYTCRIEKIGGK